MAKSRIEQRLERAEEALDPAVPTYTIRNFLDLVVWCGMPAGTRPDLSEASGDFLRGLFEALAATEAT
ncbi:MAG TPA: hypothetical protein PKJ51_03810 [Methanothrix sp.]|nr:hypothetical protein [Methanothrix sp.]